MSTRETSSKGKMYEMCTIYFSVNIYLWMQIYSSFILIRIVFISTQSPFLFIPLNKHSLLQFKLHKNHI